MFEIMVVLGLGSVYALVLGMCRATKQADAQAELQIAGLEASRRAQ